MVVVGRPALLGFGPPVRPRYGWVPFSWPHPSRDSLLCPQANVYPLEMPMCVFSNMAARSYIWHFSTWNMTNVTEKLKFLFSLILMQWKWQATCGNTLHSSSQLSDAFLRRSIRAESRCIKREMHMEHPAQYLENSLVQSVHGLSTVQKYQLRGWGTELAILLGVTV